MKKIIARIVVLLFVLYVAFIALNVATGVTHAAICHPYKNGGGCWTRTNGVTTSYNHSVKKRSKNVVYVTGNPPTNDVDQEIKAVKAVKAVKNKTVTPILQNKVTNNTYNTYNTYPNENTNEDETSPTTQYNNWTCQDFDQVCYDTYDGTVLWDGILYHCSTDYDVCVKDQ